MDPRTCTGVYRDEREASQGARQSCRASLNVQPKTAGPTVGIHAGSPADRRCQPGLADRAICTTAVDERPTELRCFRDVSVAPPPFNGTRSETVPFVSFPLTFRSQNGRTSIAGMEIATLRSLHPLVCAAPRRCHSPRRTAMGSIGAGFPCGKQRSRRAAGCSR
jgi:hypothetical protein